MSISGKNIGITLLLSGVIAAGVWAISQSNVTSGLSESETNTSTSAASNQSAERIIYRGDPPYLSNQPILDGNLFVNHSDDFLLLGGLNIEQVRFSAGIRAGGRAAVVYRDNAIAFLMEEEPYIEFSYQDKFYSLQILSRPYFFTMDFREIPSASIQLTEGFR
ncbi:MAG: hypothetical protein GKR91_06430 [Pseudomonadales bacterium]|nr:hypothetical protein [Pseudomonadales bacterium]